MAQLKRLLAATDFSSSARHAAERAALIAREVGVGIDLLHVLSLDPLQDFQRLSTGVEPDLSHALAGAAQAELEALAASLRERFGAVVDCRVARGALLKTLSAESTASAADLLVFGAHGENIFRHLLLGSTATRMLSQSRQPLLIVKQPVRRAYQTILVPVDFSASSLRSIAIARSVARKAEIILMHSFEVPFESRMRFANVDDEIINRYRAIARQHAQKELQELRERAGLSKGKTRFVVVHGDPAQRVFEEEQNFDCDLIVMGKHGKSALEEFFVGSVTKKVLAESQGDVLVSVSE